MSDNDKVSSSARTEGGAGHAVGVPHLDETDDSLTRENAGSALTMTHPPNGHHRFGPITKDDYSLLENGHVMHFPDNVHITIGMSVFIPRGAPNHGYATSFLAEASTPCRILRSLDQRLNVVYDEEMFYSLFKKSASTGKIKRTKSKTPVSHYLLVSKVPILEQDFITAVETASTWEECTMTQCVMKGAAAAQADDDDSDDGRDLPWEVSQVFGDDVDSSIVNLFRVGSHLFHSPNAHVSPTTSFLINLLLTHIADHPTITLDSLIESKWSMFVRRVVRIGLNHYGGTIAIWSSGLQDRIDGDVDSDDSDASESSMMPASTGAGGGGFSVVTAMAALEMGGASSRVTLAKKPLYHLFSKDSAHDDYVEELRNDPACEAAAAGSLHLLYHSDQPVTSLRIGGHWVTFVAKLVKEVDINDADGGDAAVVALDDGSTIDHVFDREDLVRTVQLLEAPPSSAAPNTFVQCGKMTKRGEECKNAVMRGQRGCRWHSKQEEGS